MQTYTELGCRTDQVLALISKYEISKSLSTNVERLSINETNQLKTYTELGYNFEKFEIDEK